MVSSKDNTRRIHTRLFSDKACDALDSVIGQLSDGIWENSPAMDGYWRFAEVKREPNGAIVLVVSTERFAKNTQSYPDRYGCYRSVENKFYGKPDDEVLKIFGNFVKRIMQIELKDNGIQNGWRRDNFDITSDYLSHSSENAIRVAEAYAIYEHLIGRVGYSRRYPAAFDIVETLGAPRDATKTERETKRQEDLAELEKAYNAEYDARKAAYEAKVQVLKDQIAAIDAEYTAERSKACTEYCAKRREIEQAA